MQQCGTSLTIVNYAPRVISYAPNIFIIQATDDLVVVGKTRRLTYYSTRVDSGIKSNTRTAEKILPCKNTLAYFAPLSAMNKVE